MKPAAIEPHNPLIQQVIISNTHRGGNKSDNPSRLVRQIFTVDGTLLAEFDEIIEGGLTDEVTFNGKNSRKK